MEFKDYYKILNVEATASDAEIKTAYRRLARKYHPDVSKEKGAEDKFKSVNEAYEVLRDKEKRSEYDHLKAKGYRPGEEFRPPPDRGGAGQGGFQYDFNDMGGNGGFSDFFESLFGGARRQQAPPQTGSRVKLSIPLELAYAGGKQKIRVDNRILEVNIPAGIKSGQSIRLAGQGEHKGNLMIEIEYKEHPEFELDGLNVLYTLTIMPWQAALGTILSVPTLGGIVDLKVPANSDTGKRLRLKGRGMPSKTVKGDQIVEIEISAPRAHNEQQKELYMKMAELFKEN